MPPMDSSASYYRRPWALNPYPGSNPYDIVKLESETGGCRDIANSLMNNLIHGGPFQLPKELKDLAEEPKEFSKIENNSFANNPLSTSLSSEDSCLSKVEQGVLQRCGPSSFDGVSGKMSDGYLARGEQEDGDGVCTSAERVPSPLLPLVGGSATVETVSLNEAAQEQQQQQRTVGLDSRCFPMGEGATAMADGDLNTIIGETSSWRKLEPTEFPSSGGFNPTLPIPNAAPVNVNVSIPTSLPTIPYARNNSSDMRDPHAESRNYADARNYAAAPNATFTAAGSAGSAGSAGGREPNYAALLNAAAFPNSPLPAVGREPVGRGNTMQDHITNAMLFRTPFPQIDIVEIENSRPKRRNVKISKDPQSVAARHRREKISDRMRILQRLVPGGTKMDTASMLDECIAYVKYLQAQVTTLEKVTGGLDPALYQPGGPFYRQAMATGALPYSPMGMGCGTTLSQGMGAPEKEWLQFNHQEGFPHLSDGNFPMQQFCH